MTEYFARLERQTISMNVISHVSANQVRRVVMGYEARPASASLISSSLTEGEVS